MVDIKTIETDIIHAFDKPIRKLHMAEERVSKPEDKLMDISEMEEQKQRLIKRSRKP